MVTKEIALLPQDVCGSFGKVLGEESELGIITHVARLDHWVVDILLFVELLLLLVVTINVLQHMTDPLGLFLPVNSSGEVMKLVQFLM